jgi:hypothetical protein
MKRRLFAVLALISLAFCLAVPVLHFLGRLSVDRFRLYLLLASLGWFIFAPLWAARAKAEKK